MNCRCKIFRNSVISAIEAWKFKYKSSAVVVQRLFVLRSWFRLHVFDTDRYSCCCAMSKTNRVIKSIRHNYEMLSCHFRILNTGRICFRRCITACPRQTEPLSLCVKITRYIRAILAYWIRLQVCFLKCIVATLLFFAYPSRLEQAGHGSATLASMNCDLGVVYR
jgi:hypothetical protein